MAILSCHVSIKLPPKISDGQQNRTRPASSVKVAAETAERRKAAWGRFFMPSASKKLR